jgi:hypothetical protein
MTWTASGWYGDTLRKVLVLDIELDLELVNHKLALYTTSYTPDYSAANPAYGTTNEIVGTGYVAGGSVLTTTTLVASGGYVTWGADNVTWADSTLTGVRGGLVYAAALATDDLIIGVDFGDSYDTADGSLIVSWSGSGVARIAVVSA